MNKEMIDKSIEDGIKLLDDKLVDWYQKIETHLLDMSDRYFCIIGQMYGDYSSIPYVLGVGPFSGYKYGLSCDMSIESPLERDEVFGYLTSRWKEIVIERQSAFEKEHAKDLEEM